MGLFSDLTGMGKGNPFSGAGKYVDDFKVVEAPDKKGRLRKTAVYSGTWTVLRDKKAGQRAVWASLVLSLAAAAVYFRALLLTHFGSGKLLVMAPLCLGLFPLLYLLMGCTELPYRGKPLRRDQYMHGFIRMCRSAVAVASFDLVSVVALFILRAVEGDWLFLPEDWQFLVLTILAALFAILILILLRGIDLSERENSAYKGHK